MCMRYMGILIFENSLVVLEIFDFGTGPYGPNLPPYCMPYESYTPVRAVYL
jgi:hypothetical protein